MGGKAHLIFIVFMMAVFLAACEVPDQPDLNLEGTSWQVSEIMGRSVNDDLDVSANFDNGTISGNAPCNVYSADYTQDDDELIIGIPIMTQILCEENIMEAESAFTEALSLVSNFEIDGDNLLLFDETGKTVLLLER